MEKGENKLKIEDFEKLKLQTEFSMVLSNVVIPAVISQATGQNLEEAKRIVRNTFNTAESILLKSVSKKHLETISNIKTNAINAAFLTLAALDQDNKTLD